MISALAKRFVVGFIVGAGLLGTRATAQAGDPPVVGPWYWRQATPTNGIPGKIAPPLPTDDDIAALAGACSCDASSPSGERPLELEDYRTDHDTGDPVDLHNGMVSLRRTDLCLSGRGLGFAFTRSYSSKAEAASDVYPLGQGWSHNYDLRISQFDANTYRLSNGNQRIDEYKKWTDPATGAVHWYSYGVYSELQVQENQIVLRARHGTRTYFTPTSTDDGVNPGRVTKIEDRNGNRLLFEYDQVPLFNGHLPGLAMLTKVTDPMGRRVKLDYFGSGTGKERLLHTVTDPTGRVATFDYVEQAPTDSQHTTWVLVTATSPSAPTATDPIDSSFTYGWPNGRTEGYLYFGGSDADLRYNLTGVIAPRECVVQSGLPTGQPYVKYIYYGASDGWAKDSVKEQWLGDTNNGPSSFAVGGRILYSYTTNNPLVDLSALGIPAHTRMVTSVHDRGNRVTDYYFNEKGNALQIDEYTDEFQANPHVITVFDYWWYYQTNGWGSDGEVRTIHYPDGSKEDRAYMNAGASGDTRWNHGNLISRTFTSTNGTDTRTISYVWEPVFSHPWKITDENGHTTTFLSDYMEGNASGGTNSVLQAMASELWITTGQMSTILGITQYQGLLQNVDLNGDGQNPLCHGNVVQKVYPSVSIAAQATGPASVQTWETADGQQAIYSLTYNNHGQVTSQTDPEQNATVYLYTTETDLDGNGSADGTDFTGTDSSTGGFLRRVIRDVALPYSGEAQLSGISTRNLASDLANGRNSITNPTPKAAITDLVHNLRGNLTAYTNPRGVKTDYWVNELEEIWRVAEATSVNPTGRKSGWDDNDETVGGEFGVIPNSIRRWQYDANGMTTAFQRRNDGNGNGDTGSYAGWLEQSFSYDILNRMLTRVIEVGTTGQTGTWTYTYYAGDDLLDAAQSPEGVTTQWTYTPRGQVKTVVEGSGSEAGTTTYFYNLDRSLAKVTDPRSKDTINSYDGFGRLKGVQSATGASTTYTYDAASNVTAVLVHGVPSQAQTAVDLAKTEYKYDERNRVYQIDQSDPSPQGPLTDGSLTSGDGKVTTRIDLDRLGRRIASVTDGSKVYRAYFDGLGNLVKTTDPMVNSNGDHNQVVNYFDDSGNLVKSVQTDIYPSSTNTRSFETFNIYDALNRVTSTTNNAGDTHRATYDSRDNVVATSDAQNPTNASTQINGRTVNQPGNTRSYKHNGFDQVVQEILDLRVGGNGGGTIDTSNTYNSDGKVTIATAYDFDGRVKSRTDDNSKATSYTYDSRSRVKKQTFADSTHQDYVYDAANNLTGVTDARTNVVTMSYDDDDRLTSVSAALATGTVGTRRLEFEYDGLGRRTKSTSSDSTSPTNDDWVVTRVYDGLSRVKTDAQGSVNAGTRTNTSTWAEESKRVSQLYPSGQLITYTYDDLLRLKTVRPGGGILTTYTYAGYRLHDRTYSNGYSELHHDFNLHTDTNYYDDAGRPIKMDYTNTVGTVLTSFEHAFDRMGNRKYERRVHDSNKGDNFDYDSLYRLTTFERRVDAADVGTLGHSTWQAKKAYTLDGVQNWRLLVTNGSTNQTSSMNDTEAYTAFGAATPSYDAEGNLTSPDTSAAQPITLKYDFLNRLREIVQGTQVVDHYYDAEGRRVRTTHNLGSATSIVYIYDGWGVVEEYDASANLTRKWIMGKDIDEPLQMTIPQGLTNAGTYDFQRSTLGNVVALTSTSGTVLERYTYDAYGTPQFENPSNANQALAGSAYGNPYLFNGRRYDPWIYPMYEYRTRMYAPAMGRFVQRDSIGVWGDRRQFGSALGFVGNNPIGATDPFGMAQGGVIRPIPESEAEAYEPSEPWVPVQMGDGPVVYMPPSSIRGLVRDGWKGPAEPQLLPPRGQPRQPLRLRYDPGFLRGANAPGGARGGGGGGGGGGGSGINQVIDYSWLYTSTKAPPPPEPIILEEPTPPDPPRPPPPQGPATGTGGGESPPRPEGIPEDWSESPSDGGGTFYRHPVRGKYDWVRTGPGNPGSQWPNSRKPYVRWTRNGQYLDCDGTPIPGGGKHDPRGHIPFNDFRFRPEVYEP